MQTFDADKAAEDAFTDAYQNLWDAVESDGLKPRHVISSWADCRPSVTYKWKNGRTHPDLAVVIRLTRNAAAEGYTQLASLFVGEKHRVARQGEETPVTGKLMDNIRALDMDEAKLWQAEQAGDPGLGREAVADIRRQADRIEAELDRMERREEVPTNGQMSSGEVS